jgi:hypothetical protein
LDAVAERELGQDVPDVGLDGGLAEEQLGGDFGVGLAPAEPEQDVAFAFGQFSSQLVARLSSFLLSSCSSARFW